jgi:hypothetical protein
MRAFQKAKSLIRAAAMHDVAFSGATKKANGQTDNPGCALSPPQHSTNHCFPDCSNLQGSITIKPMKPPSSQGVPSVNTRPCEQCLHQRALHLATSVDIDHSRDCELATYRSNDYVAP